MEGFTYTNIFETKALEYLIVVFFFALLVPFWMLINKKRNKIAGLSAVSMEFAVESQKLPHGIYFSRFHTWAYLKKNGVAKVGMSDLLVHLTGEVQITSFMSPGQEIIKGETLAQLHFNGKSLRLASPVSGIICQVNKLLSESPELIKDDPYQHGWIYSLKPTNWKMDASACFLAEDADAWAKSPGPVLWSSYESEIYGPGHNSFTVSPDGSEDWLVYHGKDEPTGGFADRMTRAQKFTWTEEGLPFFGEPVPSGVPMRKPGGE